MAQTRPAQARTPHKAPRFEVRFNNGVYHVFDRVEQRPWVAVGLKKLADAKAREFNARGR